MIRSLVDKASPVACVLILFGFAIAGLSPFHAPRNGAKWFDSEDGIRIRGDGVLWSERSFIPDRTTQNGCTVEIWFQAARNTGSSTILDFYQTDPHREFIIRQDGNALLQIIKSDSSGMHVLEAQHQFFPGNRILVTVTSGPSGANVYFDASATKTSGNLSLSHLDCAGQLILGSSAISYNTWNGDLYGLAVSSSSFTEARVRKHFDAWQAHGQLTREEDGNFSALYKFSERSGARIRNDAADGPDLTAPANFQIPGHPFLDNPWNEFRVSSIGWKDVYVNIFGFIPFGFFLNSFLSSIRRKRRVGVTVIIIGMVVSLTIEVLQWYLPTRDSSLTDVLTNTTGTIIGVAVYRFLFGGLELRNS